MLGDALRNSRSLAVHAERLGYNRFWMAEHHSNAGRRQRRNGSVSRLCGRGDPAASGSVRAG